MARPYPSDSLLPPGELQVHQVKPDEYIVYFKPHAEAIPKFAPDPDDYIKRIMNVNVSKGTFTFYPYRVWGVVPMVRKYKTLKSVTLELNSYLVGPNNEIDPEEIIYSMPSAFVQDYNYGLGFLKEYQQFVNWLEVLGIENLQITANEVTRMSSDNKTFILNKSHFDRIRRALDSVTVKSRKLIRDKKLEVVGSLISQFINKGSTVDVKSDLNVANKITEIGSNGFLGTSKEKEQQALEVVTSNSRKMAQTEPEKLFKLRNDIELVTLEELISKFETMLSKGLLEGHWQNLLSQNPFILNMAFGSPIIKVGEHASVGGRKIFGGGDKIADFLVKNSISNNAAIVEIKTPSTELLQKKPYREAVYAPSSEITGAVNQILDQIHKFQRNISTLKEDSREKDLETYSVIGVLIIGNTPDDLNAQKSFELFRGNSKNIQIITFDELLVKLKQLHHFLSANDGAFITDNDLPF